MSSYANEDAMVGTDWVKSHLGNGVKIVEVDEDTEAYGWGHIPGAISLNWLTELQDQVRRDLVDRAGFERLLGAKGITETDTVVLYGGNNNWFAAYAYWMFKLYGHRDVRLMNGGRKKWELEELPMVTDVPTATPAKYSANEADSAIRAMRDEVVAAVGKVPMVDVRSSDEYVGRLAAPPHLPNEQGQRKGHIPGATNIPWSKAANEDGTFKDLAELRALYVDEAGLTADSPTITYCRIGERSSHTWFVLRELLGFGGVKNYDGSWTEYGSLVGVPIQRDYWGEEE
jgi:thiosulfate/3-mercaptopyruvate sulfurtransferase